MVHLNPLQTQVAKGVWSLDLVFSLVVFTFLKLGSGVGQSELLTISPPSLQRLDFRYAPTGSAAVSFEITSVFGAALRGGVGH